MRAKKLFSSGWEALTWIAGGFAVYNHLRNLRQAKDQLFYELSHDQQQAWIKVFGTPLGYKEAPIAESSGTIEQVEAKT